MYTVTFWVDDHNDVVEYEITVADRNEAIEAAEQRLRDDGYDEWNLKQIRTS